MLRFIAKNAPKTIGNYVFSSMNISVVGVGKKKTELSLPVDICKQCRISFQMIYIYIQSLK